MSGMSGRVDGREWRQLRWVVNFFLSSKNKKKKRLNEILRKKRKKRKAKKMKRGKGGLNPG